MGISAYGLQGSLGLRGIGLVRFNSIGLIGFIGFRASASDEAFVPVASGRNPQSCARPVRRDN